MHKVIEKENGKVEFIGNGHWKEIEYGYPDWDKEELHPYFKYRDSKWWLDEIISTRTLSNNDEDHIFSDFDGYMNTSYWDGIVIKMHEFGDAVQVYRYICS